MKRQGLLLIVVTTLYYYKTPNRLFKQLLKFVTFHLVIFQRNFTFCAFCKGTYILARLVLILYRHIPVHDMYRYPKSNGEFVRNLSLFLHLYYFIVVFQAAKKWGIILGTLGRQGNPNILHHLKVRLFCFYFSLCIDI